MKSLYRMSVSSHLLAFGALFLFHFSFLVPITAVSQEALGIVNSNYTGVNSEWINPANAASIRNNLSINLIAGDVFFVSNFLFIHRKDYRFLKPFNVSTNDPRYLYIYDYPEVNYQDSVHYYDYYKNNAEKSLYLNARIAGPSISLRAGNHTFSILTAFRNNISGRNIPYDVANFMYRGLDFYPQQDITYKDGSFAFELLSWIEIGAGYAYTFFSHDRDRISAGITVKYLMGIAGAYASLNNVTYMVPDQDTLVIRNVNGTMGLSTPVDYSNNGLSLNPLVKGTGLGGDIGVTWQRMGGKASRSSIDVSGEQEEKESYLFRAGISLLDVGRIKFNKAVQVHRFTDIYNRIWPGLKNYKTTSIQQLIRSASYNMYGDSLASLTDQKSFMIWLPSAASLQFDYNFRNNVFVNATIVKGFRLGSSAVRRETLIAVTPRYETPLWEVNLPLSLVDFRHPAIGLAVRIYSLVIGTEKLGTFVNLTDVRGMDLYFSLGVNLDPKEGGGKHRHGKTKGCESVREYKRYLVH